MESGGTRLASVVSRPHPADQTHMFVSTKNDAIPQRVHRKAVLKIRGIPRALVRLNEWQGGCL